MKITTISHIREISGLELQAVEMSLEDWTGDTELVLTLGSENSGGKDVPFVAIQRKGSKREAVIHFENKHKTAETRRNEENRSSTGKPAVTKSTATAAKKAAARR